MYILLSAWASLSVALLDLYGSIYNMAGSIYKMARLYIIIYIEICNTGIY